MPSKVVSILVLAFLLLAAVAFPVVSALAALASQESATFCIRVRTKLAD